jgi:hypothetical protein
MIKGEGSYEYIVPKYKKLVEKRPKNLDYYVRGTYTQKNLDFTNDVLSIVDNGFDQVSVEPVILKNYPDKFIVTIPDGSVLIHGKQSTLAATAYSKPLPLALRNVPYLASGIGKNMFNATIYSSEQSKEIAVKWKFQASQNGSSVDAQSKTLHIIPGIASSSDTLKQEKGKVLKSIDKQGGALNMNQAVTNILESVALEEISLAHIINAEAEKLQKAICSPKATVKDIINVNKSAQKLLSKILNYQILLQFKLERVKKIAAKCKKY